MAETNDDPRAQFESIRQINPYGEEYWSARELMPLLGYERWERFTEAIERAKISCQAAGQQEADHLRPAAKMVMLGSGSQREIKDYFLSRFGCYMVAMNGDPRKPQIAAAQMYFVVQTQRAEQWDALREARDERLRLRLQLAESNKRLNAAAQEAGVNSQSFGRLHRAWTMALYGGLTVEQVKDHKGIEQREDHADRMGRAELIANDFVRSQAEQKIRNEGIQGADAAIEAHYEVGAETRSLIERTGGTLPEDLPAEPSIRPLLNQHNRRQKRLPAPDNQPTLFDATNDATADATPPEPDDRDA